MWKEQSVILNKEGKIIHIGNKALGLAKRSGEKVFAFPGGKIEKGDLMVYYCKNGEDAPADISVIEGYEKILLQSNAVGGRGFLLVGKTGDAAVAPIVKFCEEEAAEAYVLLDTIYEGCEVIVKKANEQLVIGIGEQSLKWELGEIKSCAVIADGYGIRYFGAETDHEPDVLKKVFETGAFEGMADMEYLYGRTLDEVILPAVMSAVKEMAEEKECLLNLKGTVVRITRDKIESAYGDAEILTFEDENSIIATLHEKSDAYEKMVSSSEFNSMRNQQVTMFRLFGAHEKMKETERLLQKGSNTNTTMLLTGESGTGKTFLAREIHKNSKRSDGPFVHVNCAAIPYQLIESELFGYEDGAFTGARKGGKKGYFELSNGGTLFLDEITEIPVSLQGKLLEVLQNRTFYRVGGTKKLETNIRVIAATNRDLKKEIEEKRFREDLYYRINVFPVEIPPLRERSESIYEIISDILPEICSRLEIEPLIVSSQALEKMEKYSWPGNIRELENVLEKAAIFSDG